MYFTIIYSCKTPIHLRILFIETQNRELSGEINAKMRIIEKIKKIHGEKTLSWFSLEL